MAARNNLPDISQIIKVVDPQELYNILLAMQQRIQELETKVKELEDASKN